MNRSSDHRIFDPKFIFVGMADSPFKCCQNLLNVLVDNQAYKTLKPSVRVLSMHPDELDAFPQSIHHLQIVSFCQKFDWRKDCFDGIVFVSTLNLMKIQDFDYKEKGIQDLVTMRSVPKDNILGVVVNDDPFWSYCNYNGGEKVLLQKRMADALGVYQSQIHWLEMDSDYEGLLSNMKTLIHGTSGRIFNS